MHIEQWCNAIILPLVPLWSPFLYMMLCLLLPNNYFDPMPFYVITVFLHLFTVGAPHDFNSTPGSDIEEDTVVVPESSTDIPNFSDSVRLSVPTRLLTSAGTSVFAPGDNVRVELDVEIFKMMQEGHGDWDDQLLEVRLCTHST